MINKQPGLDGKRSKDAVDYSKGMDRAKCGLCQHFEPPHGCELVRGHIAPGMWCRLFKRKS
jgi:hypothetical protein